MIISALHKFLNILGRNLRPHLKIMYLLDVSNCWNFEKFKVVEFLNLKDSHTGADIFEIELI